MQGECDAVVVARVHRSTVSSVWTAEDNSGNRRSGSSGDGDDDKHVDRITLVFPLHALGTYLAVHDLMVSELTHCLNYSSFFLSIGLSLLRLVSLLTLTFLLLPGICDLR